MAAKIKKVLVTGAAGMLGHKVLEACPEDWEVRGVDVEDFDITSQEACRSCVKAFSPEILIHCAAMTDVDGCESDFDGAYRINGIGAGHLARAAFEVGAEILHVSTDYVFDGEKKSDYFEDDNVSPLGAYGRTKLAGETFVMRNNPRNWIVRTQWLYGPGGKNFVDTILRVARERDHLEVVDDQVGCPTYTLDLARALVRIADQRPPYGVYHCSNGGSCSWFDFAGKILELAGMGHVPLRPITSDRLDRPAKRPAHSVLRNYHLALILGDPMRPWEEALSDYLASKKEEA
jgi:dTDP-4-dehydrorhamnose reductase